MITEIGIVAGEIWHCLDKEKTCKLSELVTTLDKDKNVILMSLGWLAREGHVIMESQADDYKITLRF